MRTSAKWLLGIAAVGLIMLNCSAHPAVARQSSVINVKLNVIFILTDGDGVPIRPRTGVQLKILKIGKGKGSWAHPVELRGHPDEQGYLWTEGEFPIDTTLAGMLFPQRR